MGKMLTIAQACDLLECSSKTLNRYVARGVLTKHGDRKTTRYNKKELLLLAKDFHTKKDIHNSQKNKDDNEYKPKALSEFELPEPVENKEDVLNQIGKSELLRVTKLLEDEGVLDVTHETLLFKYAYFQQKVIHYIQALEDDVFEEEDKYNMTKNLDQYQKWTQHYEKELLISTASRLKVFPPTPPEAPKVLDPMEALLNG